jgi:signal transduction histidine kinase
MNENLVWKIGLVDIPTLALAVGIGNLVLLILTWVYAKTSMSIDRSLRVWQLSRCFYVLVMVLYWLRPVAPLWLTYMVAALLVPVAWCLEMRAFQLLLGLRLHWRLIIGGIVLVFLGRLSLPLIDTPMAGILLYNSVTLSAFLALMGFLLFRDSVHGNLGRLMGGNMILLALLIFIRIFPLVWPDFPGMPSFASLHLVMWFGCFLGAFVNGFGYLLMVKQDDDEKLRQAMGELSLAEAEQRQLLSLASHEFRTPAAMIRATLDSLTYLESEITPAVAARHANIRHACQRLVHLANSLITQDRLRDLRFELVLEEVDLNQLIDEVVQRYADSLAWTPTESVARVKADPALIMIALHNLIDNALRHSSPEQPPGVELTRSRHGYELSVFDLGAGIHDSDKEKIFERFYRKDAGPGSGLGLSIVRQIARLHGGDAFIRDQAPRGARFVITLPEVRETAA